MAISLLLILFPIIIPKEAIIYRHSKNLEIDCIPEKIPIYLQQNDKLISEYEPNLLSNSTIYTAIIDPDGKTVEHSLSKIGLLKNHVFTSTQSGFYHIYMINLECQRTPNEVKLSYVITSNDMDSQYFSFLGGTLFSFISGYLFSTVARKLIPNKIKGWLLDHK